MSNQEHEEMELIRCRYKCLLCGSIIESTEDLVYCECGKLGVDANMGDSNTIRVFGWENGRSLCVWRDKNGTFYDDSKVEPKSE